MLFWIFLTVTCLLRYQFFIIITVVKKITVMRFLYLFVITLFVYQTAFCSKVDSLLIALKSEKNQNNIVDIYNKLSKEYKSLNTDSSLFYIKKAYNLSANVSDFITC